MQTQSSDFVDLTSDTVADSDGSYEDLINPVSFDVKWICVTVLCAATTLDGLLDISVGDPGSEIEVLEDRYVKSAGSTRKAGTVFYLPVEIPSGSRIRARIQDNAATAELWRVKVMVSDIAPPAGTPTQFDKSGLIALSSPAVADTYSGYSVAIASVARDAKWALIGTSPPQDLLPTFIDMEFGIGVGSPPASDTIVEYGYSIATDPGGNGSSSGQSFLIPVDFQQGDTIQIRVKDSKSSISAYSFSINLLA